MDSGASCSPFTSAIGLILDSADLAKLIFSVDAPHVVGDAVDRLVIRILGLELGDHLLSSIFHGNALALELDRAILQCQEERPLLSNERAVAERSMIGNDEARLERLDLIEDGQPAFRTRVGVRHRGNQLVLYDVAR